MRLRCSPGLNLPEGRRGAPFVVADGGGLLLQRCRSTNTRTAAVRLACCRLGLMLVTSADTLTPRSTAISFSPSQSAGSREIEVVRPSTLIVCLAIEDIGRPLVRIVDQATAPLLWPQCLSDQIFAMPVAAKAQPRHRLRRRIVGRRRPRTNACRSRTPGRGSGFFPLSWLHNDRGSPCRHRKNRPMYA